MVATLGMQLAVAKLHAVFITYFAKLVVAWKVFKQKPKKLLANVGFDAVAVRGVEPYHVSLSSSVFPLRLFLLKGETGRVAAVFEGFVVQRDRFFEFIFVLGYFRYPFGYHGW